MYGCSFDTEANIISRLQRVKLEASHPLLLPGIFAELELVRQTKLVERTINEVEAKIGELDLPACEKGRTQQETDQHNQDKRDAWLDLTYLRNAIISWNTQLQKMIHHSSKLNDEEHEVSQIIRVNTVRQDNCSREKPERMDSPLESARFAGQLVEKSDQTWHRPYAESKEEYTENPREKFRVPKDHGKKIFHTSQLSEVGNKIRSRLMAIKDENDEKIRDCSMRVDGMAMATQWVRCDRLRPEVLLTLTVAWRNERRNRNGNQPRL